MSIATVVFDFGNVLGHFSHRKAAEQLAAYSRTATADEVQALVFNGQLEDDYESGRLSTADLLALLRERFGLSGTDAELGRALADMFTPNHEVCELVPLLKARYRLLLLSNTNELHYQQFRPQFAHVLDHFDALVVSHEVGWRKPAPEIFQHAQRRAGCPAAACLFIDDLPDNVAAARACGWQGLVYRRGDDLRRALAEVGVTVAA
jgi:putative hydrolase of the HAD superfamily